ncbi:MAG TPA: methyltransferase domain-containing protein [Burkholderiaceae bacterium]|nr:methyltransferase domain-containing protein [Burkholderiaceae bacterium]
MSHSPRAFGIDPRALQRQFDRRAARFAEHDFLFREVQQRMIERLDAIRIEPACVLDIGCGPGRALTGWQTRFSHARIVGIDLSHAMLRIARDRHAPSWVNRIGTLIGKKTLGAEWVQAGFDALPIKTAAADVVLSNLALHYAHEPHRVLPEWARVLRTDGLLMFSCFGPDTLRELRELWPAPGVLEFVDMHDYGDMLIEAGFTAPVMDMEHLTLTYESAEHALRELRAVTGNPRTDRQRHLLGPRALDHIHQRLNARRDASGRIAFTLELIYGHAWKAAPRQRAERLPDGSVAVRVPLPRLR